MPNVSRWRHLGMASAVGLWTLALVIGNSGGVGNRTDDVRPCSLTFVK